MTGTQVTRFLPDNQYQAAINANVPSVINPFATIADFALYSNNIYNSNGTIPASTSRVVNLAAGSDIRFHDSLSSPIARIQEDGVLLLGLNSSALNSTASVLGTNASASAANSIAIGNNANVSGNGGVAIGNNAVSGDSISVGPGANTPNLSISIGNTIVPQSRTIAIGYNIGFVTPGVSINSVIIGNQASGRNDTVTIGFQASSSSAGGNSVAIGARSAAGDSAVAIGGGTTGAQSTGAYSIAIGYDSISSDNASIAIGDRSQATFIKSIAIGEEARAIATNAKAIGSRALANAANAIAIGTSYNNVTFMQNNTVNSIGIGFTVINPHILLAISNDSYFNTTGRFLLGNGSSAPTEGAPDNIPTNYEKFAVFGNIEAADPLGVGYINGFVLRADDGQRVLMKLLRVSPGIYAWDTGTVLP